MPATRQQATPPIAQPAVSTSAGKPAVSTSAGKPAVSTGDLDVEQLAAVRAPRGPVCVLAGAGTGKTRTITHRIAHLVATDRVKPDQVLAVTFTARAASELRNRLRVLRLGKDAQTVQALTFHAAARRQLSYFWPRVVGELPWRLVDNKYPMVARAAGKAGLPTDSDTVRELLGEIEWAKAALTAPENYADTAQRRGRSTRAQPTTIAKVYSLYESSKNQSEGLLLDFDDLLLHTAAALENHGAVAQEFRERYRCFVVDEYQDVTALQQRVLDAWLGERDDITVVGDANQTIYSFTGASPRYLLDFTRRYPDATLVRLQRDYRSTPQIVDLANRIIAKAPERVPGTRLQLVGQQKPGPEPVFREYSDTEAEARGVTGAIQELLRKGVRPAHIAVLYRINAHSQPFEQALSEAGIPYRIRGGAEFFQRPEIRKARAALHQLAERGDLPAQSDSAVGVRAMVRAVVAELGWQPNPPAGLSARETWSGLTALVQMADEFTSAGTELGFPDFLAELDSRARARHAPDMPGVTLASLHTAKGLEWDAVFLVGLSDGILPISYVLALDGSVSDPAGLEEERRLLYVGVTRARTDLQLSWSAMRDGTDRRPRNPSRLLAGLFPAPGSRFPQPAGATLDATRARSF